MTRAKTFLALFLLFFIGYMSLNTGCSGNGYMTADAGELVKPVKNEVDDSEKTSESERNNLYDNAVEKKLLKNKTLP